MDGYNIFLIFKDFTHLMHFIERGLLKTESMHTVSDKSLFKIVLYLYKEVPKENVYALMSQCIRGCPKNRFVVNLLTNLFPKNSSKIVHPKKRKNYEAGMY